MKLAVLHHKLVVSNRVLGAAKKAQGRGGFVFVQHPHRRGRGCELLTMDRCLLQK